MKTNADGVVLVTGATGNVGREVVRALKAKNLHVRVADRVPSRARELFGSGIECVRFDYRDRTTFSAADGARAVFLVRPPAIADVKQTLIPFIDEARRRGLRQVIFLSVAGADKNPLVPHHAVERHLAFTRGWTILRPGFFAQNFGDAYRRDIREDARIYVPAGGGRVAFVDVYDVADLAAAIFASPAIHERRAYTLTGAESVAFGTAASILSSVLERPIRYEPATVVGYVRHLRSRGMPWAQIGVQTVLHAGLRFGKAERVDRTLERLLGRRPRTLREYMEDHRAIWNVESKLVESADS